MQNEINSLRNPCDMFNSNLTTDCDSKSSANKFKQFDARRQVAEFSQFIMFIVKISLQACMMKKIHKNHSQKRRKNPEWLKNVDFTSDLVLRYQMPRTSLDDVLAADLKRLEMFKKINQVESNLKYNTSNTFIPLE